MVVLNATINQRFWSLYVLRIRTGVLLEPFGLCSLTITGVKDPHYLRFASDPKISANVVELPAWLFNYLNCPSTVDIKAVSEVGIPISTSDLVATIMEKVKTQLCGHYISPACRIPITVFGTLFFLSCTPISAAGIVTSATKIRLASIERPNDAGLSLLPLYQELQDRFALIEKANKHQLLASVPNVLMFTDLDRWQISGLVAKISKDQRVLHPPLSLLFSQTELDSFEEEHERRMEMFQQWWDECVVGSVVLVLADVGLLDAKALDVVSDKVRKSTGVFILFSRKEEIDRLGRAFPRLAVMKGSSKALVQSAETEFIDSFNQTVRKMSPEESRRNIETILQTAELEQVGRLLTIGLSSWDRICGYKDIKMRLQDLLYKGARNPERMLKLGLTPVKGILLHGPSGCGKTEIVKAIANDAVFPVIKIQPTDILSKYLGESESKLRRVFSKAREVRPCILFIDNIEVLGGRRNIGGSDTTGSSERLLSTLLNEMDGIVESLGVILVCCTNRLEDLDEALVRPGRLDHHIHIPLPTRDDLGELLAIWCENLHINLDHSDKFGDLFYERSCANVLAILNEFALNNLDTPLPLQSSELLKFVKDRGSW